MMRMTLGRFVQAAVAVAVACAVSAGATRAQTPAQTGSEFYLSYVAALAKAKTIDEIIPFMSKKRADQMKATPAAERAMMFDMVKELAPKNVKVVKETPSAAGATIDATGSDPAGETMKGTITLVKEAGAWKLDKDSWSNK